jgi:hypothetical protein
MLIESLLTSKLSALEQARLLALYDEVVWLDGSDLIPWANSLIERGDLALPWIYDIPTLHSNNPADYRIFFHHHAPSSAVTSLDEDILLCARAVLDAGVRVESLSDVLTTIIKHAARSRPTNRFASELANIQSLLLTDRELDQVRTRLEICKILQQIQRQRGDKQKQDSDAKK